MTRYLSIALFLIVLSSKVVWAEVITYSPNTHSLTAEKLSVSAPLPIFWFADLAPVLYRLELTATDEVVALAEASRSASSDLSTAALSLRPTESLDRATHRASNEAPTLLQSVPEPATIALLGIALLLLAAAGQRLFTTGALQEAGRAGSRGTDDLGGHARESVVLHD